MKHFSFIFIALLEYKKFFAEDVVWTSGNLLYALESGSNQSRLEFSRLCLRIVRATPFFIKKIVPFVDPSDPSVLHSE